MSLLQNSAKTTKRAQTFPFSRKLETQGFDLNHPVKTLIVGSDRLSVNYGGGQIYVKNLVRGLVERRHEVTYLSLIYGPSDKAQLDQTSCSNITEIQLMLPDKWRNGSQTSKEKSASTLSRLLRRISPEIIHANGWKEVTSLASKLADIPCVLTAHHGGIVCPAGALLNANDSICTIKANDSSCLMCCVKQAPGCRSWLYRFRIASTNTIKLWSSAPIFRSHRIPFLTSLGFVSSSIRDHFQQMIHIGQNADCVIAPSGAMAEALFRNGIPKEKIIVVPHGIPLSDRRPIPLGLGKRPLRFGYLGRINHVKGPHVMLKAFRDFAPSTYELNIAGAAKTKSEKTYYKKLRKCNQNVNAVWHGEISHDETPSFIASCDVMIHPTLCLEAFGLTIAESLSIGRPVIATRCGGAEAQIRDGENGLLISPNDPLALRAALQTLIENPFFIQKMSASINPVNSLEKHILDLEAIYKKCHEKKENRN